MHFIKIYYPYDLPNIPSEFRISLYLNPKVMMEHINKYYKCVSGHKLPISINLDDINHINELLEALFEIYNSEDNPFSKPSSNPRLELHHPCSC